MKPCFLRKVVRNCQASAWLAEISPFHNFSVP